MKVREGRTAKIVFILKEDGEAIDLPALFGITLVIINARNQTYHYTLDDDELTIEGQQGEITFSPPSENFFIAEATPYIGYFWLYTSASERCGCPSAGKNVNITVLEVK